MMDQEVVMVYASTTGTGTLAHESSPQARKLRLFDVFGYRRR
jgi:hypothetical protein